MAGSVHRNKGPYNTPQAKSLCKLYYGRVQSLSTSSDRYGFDCSVRMLACRILQSNTGEILLEITGARVLECKAILMFCCFCKGRC